MTTQSALVDMKADGSSEVWGKASGELIGDLEDMAANPSLSAASKAKAQYALDKYRNVIKLTKQYHAGETLDSVMKNVFQPVNGNPDLKQFNRKEFIKSLSNNKVLQEAYSPEDRQAMLDTVKHIGFLGNVNSLASPAGVAGLVGRSGPFALMGYQAGGQTGMMAGFAAAALVSQGLSTDMGRKVIKYLAKQGRGRVNSLELQSMMGKLQAGISAAGVAGYNAPSEGAGTNAFTNQE